MSTLGTPNMAVFLSHRPVTVAGRLWASWNIVILPGNYGVSPRRHPGVTPTSQSPLSLGIFQNDPLERCYPCTRAFPNNLQQSPSPPRLAACKFNGLAVNMSHQDRNKLRDV